MMIVVFMDLTLAGSVRVRKKSIRTQATVGTSIGILFFTRRTVKFEEKD